MMSEETKMVDREEVAEMYDLVNRITRSTVAVIDAVVQRGGFRGEELSTIGQLRDQCIQAIQLCEQFDSEE
jgi:hypothetical protein